MFALILLYFMHAHIYRHANNFLLFLYMATKSTACERLNYECKMNAPTRRVNELKNCSASFFFPFFLFECSDETPRLFAFACARSVYVCVCVCVQSTISLYMYVCVCECARAYRSPSRSAYCSAKFHCARVYCAFMTALPRLPLLISAQPSLSVLQFFAWLYLDASRRPVSAPRRHQAPRRRRL